VGGGFGDGVGVGAVLVADGAAFVAVGVADDGVTTAGLARFGPTTAGLEATGLMTAGLEATGLKAVGLAADEVAVDVANWLLGAGRWLLEAAGWLLVQAPSAQAVATAISHLAGLASVCRLVAPCRRIWPG
jgi:hypothetical protein